MFAKNRRFVKLLWQLFFGVGGMLQPAATNNIRVSQVAFAGQDITGGHVRIPFDLG